MMRIILLFTALTMLSCHAFSQSGDEQHTTDVFKVTILEPGISFEKSTGRNQTAVAKMGVSFSGSFTSSSSMGDKATFVLDPALTLGYRFYYNYNKREEKGKRTAMNSLNYLSPVFETSYSKNAISSNYLVEEKRRLMNTVGLVWGIQRNYMKRFSLDLQLGAGYLFANSMESGSGSGNTIHKMAGRATTIGRLSLGIWLNRKE